MAYCFAVWLLGILYITIKPKNVCAFVQGLLKSLGTTLLTLLGIALGPRSID